MASSSSEKQRGRSFSEDGEIGEEEGEIGGSGIATKGPPLTSPAAAAAGNNNPNNNDGTTTRQPPQPPPPSSSPAGQAAPASSSIPIRRREQTAGGGIATAVVSGTATGATAGGAPPTPNNVGGGNRRFGDPQHPLPPPPPPGAAPSLMRGGSGGGGAGGGDNRNNPHHHPPNPAAVPPPMRRNPSWGQQQQRGGGDGGGRGDGGPPFRGAGGRGGGGRGGGMPHRHSSHYGGGGGGGHHHTPPPPHAAGPGEASHRHSYSGPFPPHQQQQPPPPAGGGVPPHQQQQQQPPQGVMGRPKDPRLRGMPERRTSSSDAAAMGPAAAAAAAAVASQQQQQLPLPPPPPPRGHHHHQDHRDHHRDRHVSGGGRMGGGGPDVPSGPSPFRGPGGQGPPMHDPMIDPQRERSGGLQQRGGPPRGGSGQHHPPMDMPPLQREHSREGRALERRPPDERQQPRDVFRGLPDQGPKPPEPGFGPHNHPRQPVSQQQPPPPHADGPGFHSRQPSRDSADYPPSGPPPFRRGSEYRNDPPFRSSSGESSYYGPEAKNKPGDFRHMPSPQQRGRPIHGGGGRGGPPLPPRQGSFGGPGGPGGGFGRRNDPRFAAKHDPASAQTDQALASSSRSFDAPQDQDESHQQKPPPPYFRKQPPYGQQPDAVVSTDSFGRTRSWGVPRSPQASPRNRRSTFNLPSQGSPPGRSGFPPPLPGTTPGRATVSAGAASSDHRTGHARGEESGSGVAAATSRGSKPNAAAASEPPARVEEPPPEPLSTSALGEVHVQRAEKVVDLIVDLTEKPELKGSAGRLSDLPNKTSIIGALGKLDIKLKRLQKSIDDKEKEVAEEVEKEESAKLAAIAEAKRVEQERLRLIEEKRAAEAKAREHKLQEKRDQRLASFALEKQKACDEMKRQMEKEAEKEQQRRLESVQQQLKTAVDESDVETSKARDLQTKLVNQAKKTEAKIIEHRTQLDEASAEEESGTEPVNPETSDFVARILAENRRRAAEAHMLLLASSDVEEIGKIDDRENLTKVRDPKYGKTNGEWALLANQVTGLSNALYTEPSEAPYYEHNQKTHERLGPLVKEHVRHKRKKLKRRWTELAEEYEFRRKVYDKNLHKRVAAKGKQRCSVSLAVRQTIMGAKQPAVPMLESQGGRAATKPNPYRRARRGNEVRSEYEQEQIIAELAAKEAMEKKISFGGSKLPRQVGPVERSLTATFVNTFESQRFDPHALESDLAVTNVWTDMEKCIFLDRFLQHPKDFRKIASFLRNKTTRDCVAFYYDSKQFVPYKAALREHIMRRKRRGDYQIWDATIQAALSVGAIVEAGTSEDKPLVFRLPDDDHTYFSRDLHPMKREIFDSMEIDMKAAEAYENESDTEEPRKVGRPRKRPRADPLFLLTKKETKFLRMSSKESFCPPTIKKTKGKSSSASGETGPGNDVSGATSPARKTPQKWTAKEKKLFLETLEKRGRNWTVLSEVIGTRTVSQIKSFYYEYKKQQSGTGRQRSDKEKKSAKSEASKAQKREDRATPTSTIQDSAVAETPLAESVAGETPEAQLQLQRHEQQRIEHQQHQQLQLQQQREQLLLLQQQQQHQAQLRQAQIRHQQQSMENEKQRQLAQSQYPTSQAMQAAERSAQLSRSRSNTPDSVSNSELWAHAQQQALLAQHQQQLQQQQHHQQEHNQNNPHQATHSAQITEELARRLLQHHSQSQHQQILSNLLPLLAANQAPSQSHPGPSSNAQALTEGQQLQNLLQLQQQTQRNQNLSQTPLSNLSSASPHVHSILAALEQQNQQQASQQQQQHHQHHHHQQQQQYQALLQARQNSLHGSSHGQQRVPVSTPSSDRASQQADNIQAQLDQLRAQVAAANAPPAERTSHQDIHAQLDQLRAQLTDQQASQQRQYQQQQQQQQQPPFNAHGNQDAPASAIDALGLLARAGTNLSRSSDAGSDTSSQNQNRFQSEGSSRGGGADRFQ